MFESMTQGMREARIAADPRSLAELVAFHSLVEARLTAVVAEFDTHKLWDLDGATSTSAWLRDHGMSPRVAHHLTRTARRVSPLPATAAAWVEGKLSSGQVELIAEQLSDPASIDLFAEQEHDLLPSLFDLNITDTVAFMKEWRERADAVLDRPEAAERERELHHSKTLHGRVAGKYTLDPLSGEIVGTALRVATTTDIDAEPRRTPATRRADALVDICRFYLDHQHDRPDNRNRPHLNVIVRSDGVRGWRGHLMDQTSLPKTDLQMLVCDSIIHRHITDDTGGVLDHGTGVYTAGRTLYNALVIRDGGCRFPGCDRPPQWTEAHHIQPFNSGGPTSADNMVLLCSRHHHHIHRPGWHTTMTPLGTLEITDPNGTTRTSRPPRALGPPA